MSYQRHRDSAGLFAQNVIDAIPGMLCILDRDGTIIAVNRAWREFRAANSARDDDESIWSVGANYLRVCEQTQGGKTASSLLMASGIRAVAEGRQNEFTYEYTCHSPQEQRWFSARVTPFHDQSGNMMVVHENITPQRRAGRQASLDDLAATAARHETIDQISAALERREFILYYQPKVNMRSGEVIGVEALIRWQHPVRGLLGPASFLPAIEGHPLSIDLGQWVIEAALAQMADWRAQGQVMPVSVNIGSLQLQQPDFLRRLKILLAAYPTVQPDWLELEILETSALEDMVLVSQTLQACRDLGVGCSLDDFGTGYCSLAYLRLLPADTIKIDQSFVSGMIENDDDLVIIQGLVGLAKSFQRTVIAEGVETTEQGQRLIALGCDLAQGYRIARPMPADAIPAWVTGWRPDPAWCQ